MQFLTISGITGTPPYDVQVCDLFFNNCFTISGATPPILISLPSAYNSAPALSVTLKDANNCERFEFVYCNENYPSTLCLLAIYEDAPTSFIEYPISLNISDPVNNLPSYTGTFFTTDVEMSWDGSSWQITPFGVSNPSIDLFYGLWGSSGSTDIYLNTGYCPSICVFTDDGVIQTSTPLQFTIYDNYPIGTDLTAYQDSTLSYSVEWNSGTSEWEYYEFGVLQGTLAGSENVTPIGSWTIDPGSTYTTIVTNLVCTTISSSAKQFQDTNYFFFMDSVLYNFQN